MSLLFKTGLEEYARQCTVQRRRYEDCLQQARQSGSSLEAVRTETTTPLDNAQEAFQVNQTERATEHSCMMELLELSVDPLCWDDSESILSETSNAGFEEQQWQPDRLQKSHQNAPNPSGKSVCSVSYGAP